MRRKYVVVYNTKHGGTGVVNVYKTKAKAIQQVKAAKKSSSFKKLGYSKPRIKLNN